MESFRPPRLFLITGYLARFQKYYQSIYYIFFSLEYASWRFWKGKKMIYLDITVLEVRGRSIVRVYAAHVSSEYRTLDSCTLKVHAETVLSGHRNWFWMQRWIIKVRSVFSNLGEIKIMGSLICVEDKLCFWSGPRTLCSQLVPRAPRSGAVDLYHHTDILHRRQPNSGAIKQSEIS